MQQRDRVVGRGVHVAVHLKAKRIDIRSTDDIEGVPLASLQVLHDPLHEGSNLHGQRSRGARVQIHHSLNGSREDGRRVQEREGVDDGRAGLHAEHAGGVEHERLGRRSAHGTMNLKGDHVGSLLHARGGQNDVESGEGRRIVDLNGLRVRVEVLDDVKASHLVAVEVNDNTSSVLHTHVQHLIVVNTTQLEGLADVRGHAGRVGNALCLSQHPRRVVKGGRVPASRSLSILIHSPLREIDLEGEVGGEGRGDGARRTVALAPELLDVQLHRSHIHRQRVTGIEAPAISETISSLEGVETVVHTEVQIIVAVSHREHSHGLKNRSRRSTTLIELPAVLVRIVVGVDAHCHQTLSARTRLTSQ